MQDIVNAIPYGASIVLSITTTDVIDGRDGEVFIWKPSMYSVLHKAQIILRSTPRAATTLINGYYIGYLKSDDPSVSLSTYTCQWYKPTLTAVE